MYDQPVEQVMQRRKLLKLPPLTAVSKAAKLMASKGAGAVLVVEDERLVGIFTERDVVYRVVARGLDAGATPLAEVMTPAPETVDPDKPFGYALQRMHDRGCRHLPVVSAGKIVGMVSARSAMDPAVEEFVAEARRRQRYRTQS